MSVQPGAKITQADMAALATLANSKTTLPKYKIPGNSSSGNQNYAFPDWTPGFECIAHQFSTPYIYGALVIDSNGNCQQCTTAGTSSGSSVTWSTTLGATTNDGTCVWTMVANPNPKWLTELNRLRGNLFPVIAADVTAGSILPWQQQSISGGMPTPYKAGGWPLAGPNVNTKYLGYWYADNGSAQSVTLTCAGTVSCKGDFTSRVSAQIPPVITNTLLSDHNYRPLIFTATTSPPSAVFIPSQVAVKQSANFSLLIGGTNPVLVQGDFVVRLQIFRGGTWSSAVYTPQVPVNHSYHNPPGNATIDLLLNPDSPDTGPIPTPTVDYSLWIPGSTNTIFVPSSWSSLGTGYIYVICRVNGLVNPGRYTLNVTSVDPDDSLVINGTTAVVSQPTLASRASFMDGASFTQFMTGYGYNTFNPATGFGSGNPTIQGSTLGPGLPAPGVHNSQAVLFIDCSSWFKDYPYGITSLTKSETNTWTASPFPAPTFGPEIAHQQTASFTETIAGYWTGCCPAVSNLNVAGVLGMSVMPWNYVCKKDKTGGGTFYENPMLMGNPASYPASGPTNSYAQSTFVEKQVEPPAWLASTPFTVGFVIMDSNGNFQKVTTAGASYTAHPAWPKVVGSTVTDGTVVWTCVKVIVAPDTWAPQAYYNVGATIIDSNGNTQTQASGWQAAHAYTTSNVINDANNNSQHCTTPGTSGATEPAWSTTFGGTTTDGTAVWTNVGSGTIAQSGLGEPAWGTSLGSRTVDFLATWQLTNLVKPILPAVKRQQFVPRYPFYWYGNTSNATTWVHGTPYAQNATVIDSNGRTQQCTTPGTSGGAAPAWASTLGSTTNDGTVVWTLILLTSEIAWLKPPVTGSESEKTIWGCGNQWQRNFWTGSPGYDNGFQFDNLAKGWWIYSISLNRTKFEVYDVGITGVGQVGFGAGSLTPGIGGSAQEVSVTIGCIRNNAFVAFGTFQTGQTYQVLWPIFTSDALVYQCSERIDLQAVAIGTGGAGVTTGTTANSYPICAAFVSDVTALLNLIT